MFQNPCFFCFETHLFFSCSKKRWVLKHTVCSKKSRYKTNAYSLEKKSPSSKEEPQKKNPVLLLKHTVVSFKEKLLENKCLPGILREWGSKKRKEDTLLFFLFFFFILLLCCSKLQSVSETHRLLEEPFLKKGSSETHRFFFLRWCSLLHR